MNPQTLKTVRQAHVNRMNEFAVACTVHLLNGDIAMAKHCANLAKQSHEAADSIPE